MSVLAESILVSGRTSEQLIMQNKTIERQCSSSESVLYRSKETAQLLLKLRLHHAWKSYGLILPHANVLFSHLLYGQKNSEG